MYEDPSDESFERAVAEYNATQNLPTYESIIQSLSGYPDYEEIEYENTLGDNEACAKLKWILDELPFSIRFCNIISGMGSGKTYSLTEIAVKAKLKTIFLVPLQVIVTQNYSRFKDNVIGKVHGTIRGVDKIIPGVTQEEVDDLINNPNIRVIFCVYNSFRKILNSILSMENMQGYFPFNLVVDEAHNMVTQYNFRYPEIILIYEYFTYFDKVLFLSGTPEGCLSKKFKTYIFNAVPPKPKQQIEIIKIKDRLLFSVFNIILSFSESEVLVVLIDDKDKLEELRRALVNKGFQGVRILHAENKDCNTYRYIENEEELPDDVKILLTTRVIADGTNIKTFIHGIILVNVYDQWMKRQFISRFRHGAKNIFDIVFDTTKKLEPFPIFDDFINSRTRYAKASIDGDKSKFIDLPHEIFTKPKIDIVHHRFPESDYYYSERYRTLKISKLRMSSRYCDMMNRQMMNDHSFLGLFLEKIGKYEISWSNFEDRFSLIIEVDEFNKLVTELNIGDFKDNQVFVEDNFNELMCTYIKNYKTDEIFAPASSKFSDTKENFSSLEKKYIEQFKPGFKDNRRIFKDIFELAKDGYPLSILKKLCAARMNYSRTIFNNRMKPFSLHMDYIASNQFPDILNYSNPFMMENYVIPYHFRKRVEEIYTSGEKKITPELIGKFEDEFNITKEPNYWQGILAAFYNFKRIPSTKSVSVNISHRISYLDILIYLGIEISPDLNHLFFDVPASRLRKNMRTLLKQHPDLAAKSESIDLLKKVEEFLNPENLLRQKYDFYTQNISESINSDL